jgi:hypothetical protein
VDKEVKWAYLDILFTKLQFALMNGTLMTRSTYPVEYWWISPYNEPIYTILRKYCCRILKETK